MSTKNRLRAMLQGTNGNAKSMGLGDRRVLKVTKRFSDFSAAALTNNIRLLDLPPGCVITGMKMKHRQAFTGGAVASCTISVGPAGGTATKYQAATSVFGAPSANGATISRNAGQESEEGAAAVGINAYMTTTTANISALTGGIVDFYFELIKMG
jgi:hypothetical protein